MEHHEYRILTTCAEWPFPLFNVFDEIGGKEDPVTAVALFQKLFAQGDLFARPHKHRPFLGARGGGVSPGTVVEPTGVQIVPTAEQIRAAILTNEPALVFGMTEQGAARWEAFAKPDWDRYIDVGDLCIDKERDEWETHVRGRIQSRLELALQLEYVGKPIPGSEQWETVSPWQATYWKTLPAGLHVKLRTRGLDETLLQGPRAAEMARFFSWFQTAGAR